MKHFLLGIVDRSVGFRSCGDHSLGHFQSVDHFLHVLQIAGRGWATTGVAGRAAADRRRDGRRRRRRRSVVMRRWRSFGAAGSFGADGVKGRRAQRGQSRQGFRLARRWTCTAAQLETVRGEAVLASMTLAALTAAAGRRRRRGRQGSGDGQDRRQRKRRRRWLRQGMARRRE